MVKVSIQPISKSLSKKPFDSGNEDLNTYLKRYAFKNDQMCIGKTFLALDENEIVVGYFTVSSAQVAFAELPESITKKLPKYPVPAFRIGKLAVSQYHQGYGIGKNLLKEALKRALQISSSVAVQVILVDAIDKNAKNFYLKFGFIPFQGNPLALFLPLETIKKAYSLGRGTLGGQVWK